MIRQKRQRQSTTQTKTRHFFSLSKLRQNKNVHSSSSKLWKIGGQIITKKIHKDFASYFNKKMARNFSRHDEESSKVLIFLRCNLKFLRTNSCQQQKHRMVPIVLQTWKAKISKFCSTIPLFLQTHKVSVFLDICTCFLFFQLVKLNTKSSEVLNENSL